jgi:WD40 repeat protein
MVSYSFSNDDSIVEKIATFRYESIPESIAFAPCMTSSSNNTTSVLLSDIIISSEVNAYDLIVGLRDDTNLRYINCQNTSVQKLVSLNERDWDTHCSFTPLQMSLSPNNKYLLVATDKNYHILYALRTNKRVRIFSDHTCNEYGKPKISWDKTGKYIYSNTEFEHTIYVYSVVTERVVYKLNGHTGSVRDLAYRETDRMLISCSFDKTVRIWRNEEM